VIAEILFFWLVFAFAAGAGAHFARSWRNRSAGKYLVYFKGGGSNVFGSNMHRRLIAAGVVEKSIAL